jgi:hypothetical protein
MEGLGRHRPVPLGHKDVRGQPLFALQTSQRAYLVALRHAAREFELILTGSHAAATSLVHWKPVPSTHMRRMITAKRRASADA